MQFEEVKHLKYSVVYCVILYRIGHSHGRLKLIYPFALWIKDVIGLWLLYAPFPVPHIEGAGGSHNNLFRFICQRTTFTITVTALFSKRKKHKSHTNL